MTKSLLACALLLAAAPVLAQQEAPPRWTFGVLAADRDAPYVGLDEGLLVVPLVRFEGERAYLRGLRGGWRLRDTGTHEISIFGQARTDGYDAKDSPFLAGMSDREFSLDLGVASTWTVANVGQIEAAVSADALDRSGGYEAALSWNGLFRAGGFTFIPGVSARWQSDDIVDYYYGVRAGEALPGRAAYRGSAAVTPDLSLLVQRPLGPRWSVFARASHAWLPSEISNSPIVDRDSTTSIFLGLGYSPE
ncbi:MipA/OmpV family protein [Arenimonas alkanexedens]